MPLSCRLLQALALAGGVALAIGVAATPAAAHGVGGVDASNYETTLLSVEPAVEGIEVRVVDLGDRLEVTNRTGSEVVVVGYEGEPYIRIGPDGVHENRRSPSAWANRERYGSAEAAPPEIDPDAAPEWQQVGSGDTARFHWHLAHWMAQTRPGVVDADPDAEHLLLEWDLEIEHAPESVVARGELRWVPAPSPVPALLLGLAAAALVIVGGRTRFWRWVLVGGLAFLAGAELTHMVGLWAESSSDTWRRALENVYSMAGIALALLAIVRLAPPRRDPYDATPLALLAGIVLAIAGGLADLGSLTRSQLPTSLSPTLARVLVTLTLGVGIGVVVTAATRLRRPTAATSSSV